MTDSRPPTGDFGQRDTDLAVWDDYRVSSPEPEEDDDTKPTTYQECYANDDGFGKISHPTWNADAPWSSCDDGALVYVEDKIKQDIKESRCTWPDVRELDDIQTRLTSRWNKMKNQFDHFTANQEAARGREKFNTYYFTEAGEAKTLEDRNYIDEEAPLLMSTLLSLGLNLEDETVFNMMTYSKNDKNRLALTCCSGIILSPVGPILGAWSNYARQDENRFIPGTNSTPQPEPLSKQRALKHSELVFQQLMQHFHQDAEQVGKLAYIWRADIKNSITNRTILKAHQAMNIRGICWGRFTENSEDEKEREQFTNLVATENGSVGEWLLADHPEVFKSRITDVFTFPRGSLPGVGYTHMVFKLGPR